MDRPVKVIHVSGTGRCGTKLLREMLGHHPDVCTLPFETRFTVDPDGILDFYSTYNKGWTPYVATERLKRLATLLHRMQRATSYGPYASWELQRCMPDFFDATSDLLKELHYYQQFDGTYPAEVPLLVIAKPLFKSRLSLIFRNYLQRLYRGMLIQANKTVFVDDNTWSILYASQLQELVPDSVMVHVIRHPLDVIASMTKQRWCPQNPVMCAEWYSNIMWQIRRVLRIHDIGEVEVRYENLLLEPVHTLTGLCRDVGLAVDEVLITKMCKMELYLNQTNRWRRELPEDSLDEIIEIVRPHLEYLGYEV